MENIELTPRQLEALRDLLPDLGKEISETNPMVSRYHVNGVGIGLWHSDDLTSTLLIIKGGD